MIVVDGEKIIRGKYCKGTPLTRIRINNEFYSGITGQSSCYFENHVPSKVGTIIVGLL